MQAKADTTDNSLAVKAVFCILYAKYKSMSIQQLLLKWLQ